MKATAEDTVPTDTTPADATPTDTAPTDSTTDPDTAARPAYDPDLAAALDDIESYLLGGAPSLTRIDVAERSGVPIEVAEVLWRLLGFPHAADDEVAFTELDVEALTYAVELADLGVLSEQRQSALVRTWGRSFARLAEWQSTLLADIVAEDDSGADPGEALTHLMREVTPRVAKLQDYVWRRHLVSAGARTMASGEPTADTLTTAVGFVDIVGYTSRSKTLTERELVDWLEGFEAATLDLLVAHEGRIIKNIGDEVLFVTDDPASAVDAALEMVRRGADDDDPFPDVRAGVAYGPVVHRLGDVFGPTVNIAARLTSVARPGTVLVDRGAHDALTGATGGPGEGRDAEPPGRSETHHSATHTFKRVRRISVKGYSHLAAWAVRHHG